MSNKIPMVGKRFGRLVVLEEAGRLGSFLAFNCQCDCGNTVVVRGPSLRSKNTTSCGCLQKEVVGNLNKTHGMCQSTEYRIWSNMLSRCTNPNVGCYERYGGKGITVSEDWKAFEQFYADMGERPKGKTLDRIDSDGPYSKENCRWATIAEQNRNTRRTQLVTYDGRTMCLKDWAEELQMPYKTLHKRIRVQKWPVEKAMTTPLRSINQSPFSLARAR
jgi:hypothetical protein